MSYIVFARKFRPQGFEEVVGQEAVLRTLQNALREKRIAQSFLFSGPRGIGKTSLARIVAKALNCEKGISPESCQKCISCVEITEGRSLDVLEIDGASNRGVEEVRNLREHVRYKATQGRFKIYIIDEVHMLTEAAFNALLKTLEEPPEHVKFIFATTELHKVPLTIASRCQRYPFARIPLHAIAAKLRAIAKQEKIRCDDRSFLTLARLAEGSLRDAESLLEQLASFTGGNVTEEETLNALGLSPEESYLTMIRALQGKEPRQVLRLFQKLVEEGKDLVQWVRGLLETFRNLLILRVLEDPGSLVEIAPESLSEYQKLKEEFSAGELLAMLSILQNLWTQARRLPAPQMTVEMTLLQLASREELASLGELFQRLEALERKVAPQGLLGEAVPSPGDRTLGPVGTAPKGAAPFGTASVAAKKKLPSESAEAPSRDAPAAFTLDQVELVWPQLIDRVKAKKISAGMFLSEAEPVEVEGNCVTFGLPQEFRLHHEVLERRENKELIEGILQELLGFSCSVKFVTTETEKTQVPVPPAPEKEKLTDIVESALKIFQGKIVSSAPKE